MSLNGDHLQPKRGGTYAWLISGEFTPQTTPKCMTFFYYMYQRVIGELEPFGSILRTPPTHARVADAVFCG